MSEELNRRYEVLQLRSRYPTGTLWGFSTVKCLGSRDHMVQKLVSGIVIQ